MKKKFFGYIRRFVILHILSYIAVGIACMVLQNYSDGLNTMEAFTLYRDLEQPVLAALLIPTQIVRGTLLGLFLFPFYNKFIVNDKGWLKLFLLLYGLTFAVLLFPGIFVDVYKTIINEKPLGELLFGTLEVTIQMLLFSYIFFKWESKKVVKQI